MRIKIAFRNTFRNKRRTALNVLMIASGVSAIILFRGFAFRILYDLREVTIRTQTGHLQLAKDVFWEKNARNPKDTLLENYHELTETIRRNPHVAYASGRLAFFGLLSIGEVSFSARGISLDPVAEKDKSGFYRMTEGSGLQAEKPFQVMVGSGLAKRLRLKAGDNVTVLGYTFDGVVNALDLEVAGIFRTALTEFDDNTFVLPLSTAQTLMDTDKVEQIVVGLDRTDHTEEDYQHFQKIFAGDTSVRWKPWTALADYYQQALSFFTTQNQVLEFIIVSLMLLGVLNTIGMSIFERAGEIGTLRALGETERQVLLQFTLEGGILGVLGALSGVVAGTLAAWLINSFSIPIVIPGASIPLKVKIDLFIASYREAILLAVCAAVVSAFIPALRASRMNIVDALKRYV